MMKKLLLSICLGGFVLTSGFSQAPKPQFAKKHSTILPVEQSMQGKTDQALFQHQFQTTANDELKITKSFSDEIGMTHHKYQQYYKGVIVEGATVTLHGEMGETSRISGDYRGIDEMSVTPTLSAEAAFQAALNHVGAKKYLWEEQESHKGHDHGHDYEKPSGDLVVYIHSTHQEAARLAYKFDIYASEPLYRAEVYIDANTGAYITENQKIHTSDVGATCSTSYNGTRNITADYTGSNYRLRQAADGGGIETYSLNNGTNYNNASDVTSNSTSFTSDPTANQAHWGAEQTHKYFQGTHNRNSYNGNGAVIRSYVHYSSNYVNAFWDGSRMTYGDGDGNNYGPLVSLDIVGHEITHGVTEYSANLVYSYESGALNESFSDIFGEAIENYATGSNDWQMGADIGIGGSGAIRSMNNPNAFGHPDTYQGNSWHTASSDNGGVHINSGVQNKWFYILSVGESGTNDNGDNYNVTGIGIDKAAQIAYRNLAVYLSTNSQYSDARAGAIQAAEDLYGVGSTEANATAAAWCAVGVGSVCESTPPPPLVCGDDGNVTLTITFDNYPEETAWTITSGGATVASGGTYGAQADGSTISIPVSLANGDYSLNFTDAYGDGICCSYGQGSYTLTSGGATLVTGGSFGSSISDDFCIDAGSTPTPGCTDPDAHNYDPNADTDDGSCETCSDGIQNGDETGVDCGGAKCSPCPVLGCTDAGAHNYDPNADTDDGSCETCSDGIQNGDETAVDCGGTKCNPCSVLGCTDAGAHNYDPNATHDDGSCETCSDGKQNGDETGIDCGGALCAPCGGGDIYGCTDASAHNYNPDATTDDGSCETCSDGIQNGDETGVDCGGSLCDPCDTGGCTYTTIDANDFESGWGIWNDGGSDCRRSANDAAYANSGSYCARLRDNTSTSVMTTDDIDLSNASELTIDYSLYTRSMENNEDFWVQVSTNGGASYATVAAYAQGTDFVNNTRYADNIVVAGPFSANTRVRFRCDASGNSDWVYIDDVVLSACTSSAVAATWTDETPTIEPIVKEETATEQITGINLFPNPASDKLNVAFTITDLADVQLSVVSITGKVVERQQLNELTGEQVIRVDASQLTPGYYFVQLVTEGEIKTEKFVIVR